MQLSRFPAFQKLPQYNLQTSAASPQNQAQRSCGLSLSVTGINMDQAQFAFIHVKYFSLRITETSVSVFIPAQLRPARQSLIYSPSPFSTIA